MSERRGAGVPGLSGATEERGSTAREGVTSEAPPNEGEALLAHACKCGFGAANPGDLTDHLFEVFLPAHDTGTDGRTHAELFPPGADGSLWECQCGFTTIEMAAFDAHLLAAFAPADEIGRDGRRHAPAG